MTLYGPNGAPILSGTSVDKKEEQKHRLLVCYQCFTMEKLAPYKGREDEHGRYIDPDPALEYLIQKHHTDSDGEPHRGVLLRCDESTWNNLDAQIDITKQLFKDQAERVALRDNISEDAMGCFRKHGRPTDGCIDFRDGSKKLPSPTGKGVNTNVYLCDFCPVMHGTVLPELRSRHGLDK